MTERNLPESALFAPIAAWLKAQGYKVFAEAWGHDVAAIRESDGHTICIEMKTSCSKKLLEQVHRAGSYFDAVYGAVPKMPRSKTLESWKQLKLGLLLVTESGVSIHLQAECRAWKPTRDRAADSLRKWTPDEDRIGGVPCLAGDGGAQRVCRAIVQYRASNPKATWRDIFRDVPNHYSSFESMRGAMRMLTERTAWKERRKKNLAAAYGLARREMEKSNG